MRGDSYQLQGQQGGRVINAADAAVTGVNYRWISVVENTVLSVLTNAALTGAATKLITITLPAGFGFGGKTTAVTVTSGTIIGYSGNDA